LFPDVVLNAILSVDDVSAEPDLAGWMLKKKKKQGLQKGTAVSFVHVVFF